LKNLRASAQPETRFTAATSVSFITFWALSLEENFYTSEWSPALFLCGNGFQQRDFMEKRRSVLLKMQVIWKWYGVLFFYL